MDQLRQVLAQPDTVLFIGSGISLWSGLPSWSGLINELADFVDKAGMNADLIRNEARRGDLLQAASYGFDKLTPPQIGNFIRTVCRYGIAKPHDIHRKIVSLGPRCFVTTNYDNLIEESLRLWQPDRFFPPPVTNRHLTETAGIVHARAIDFVFKPHGDAADSDSIILTREQYRQLLPGGERQAALESVKMLLASRPVVYLGFGLRDPDFMYVRDLLSNTYKGGIRDHYAIIADTTDGEAEYWRRNYGIHLVSYLTTEDSSGSRDHSALLELLDVLLASQTPAEKSVFPVGEVSSPPELILALARHAGRLTRFPKNDIEFPIRVHLEKKQTRTPSLFYHPDNFDHSPVDHFLEEGPDHALLIGLPGAGKTYSLKRAAAHLGEKLNQACLTENYDEKNVLIPVLVDLKLYRGDLQDLVEKTLPRGLSLTALSSQFKMKILLDSFNEMPREQLESGAYEADFARFIESLKNTSLIICSRTSDGLTKLNFPSYNLDQIDETYIRAELQNRQIQIDGRFKREIRWLLQNPFYFQLYVNGAITPPHKQHPRDIFQSFFQALNVSFEAHFDISFHLVRALSIIAFDAMNYGEESQPLSHILQVLNNQLKGEGGGEIEPLEVANWLVSKSIFIPYVGGRIAFFHQSVTEFLASTELAKRYQSNPQILQEKLSLSHWDQVIYLTLSLLPQETGTTFVRSIIEIDFPLALKASKYLEGGRDAVVANLLSEIPGRIKNLGQFELKMENALRYGVPVSDVHESQLREIMACGDTIGAAAVELLVELKGASVKAELLQSMFNCRDDYNYCCNGIAPAIRPFIDKEDLNTLVFMADSITKEVISKSDNDKTDGFTSGVAELLGSIELSAIKDAFLPSGKSKTIPEVNSRILCDTLRSRHSTAALELSAELLLRGVDEAATTIFFIGKFVKPENDLSWSSFSYEHVNRLLTMLQKMNEKGWALKSLQRLCAARPDLAEVVGAKALNEHGLLKAALLLSSTPNKSSSIYNALSELADMDDDQRLKEPIFLLKQLTFDWTGHEELLVRLLKLRDANLALAILGEIKTIGDLEIGPIEWWLDWLKEDIDPHLRWWLRYYISRLFQEHLPPESLEAFVAEFNKPDSKYRRVLAKSILLAQGEITTDNFSEDAISFLLASLREQGAISRLHGHLLGNTATESFVTDHLLPLLSSTEEPLATQLRQVLINVGSRHGHRYVTS